MQDQPSLHMLYFRNLLTFFFRKRLLSVLSFLNFRWPFSIYSAQMLVGDNRTIHHHVTWSGQMCNALVVIMQTTGESFACPFYVVVFPVAHQSFGLSVSKLWSHQSLLLFVIGTSNYIWWKRANTILIWCTPVAVAVNLFYIWKSWKPWPCLLL